MYEFNSNLLPQLNKRETYFAINIISGMNAQYTVSLQLLLVDVVFCFVLFFYHCKIWIRFNVEFSVNVHESAMACFLMKWGYVCQKSQKFLVNILSKQN